MSGAATASAVTTIRVAVAVGCVLARRALRDALAGAGGLEVIADCGDVDELRAAIALHQPEVVITDIRMPPTMTDEGVRVAAELRVTHPAVAVILLSSDCEPEYVVALLRDGTDQRAYLLKERLADVAQLVATIEVVARGGSIVDAKVAQTLRADAARVT